MISVVLALAAIAAVCLSAMRVIRQRRAQRHLPGATRRNPIVVTDYREIDAAIASQSCSCQARFRLRGEGPVSGEAQAHLRVASLECTQCGRDRRVYFDLASASTTRTAIDGEGPRKRQAIETEA